MKIAVICRDEPRHLFFVGEIGRVFGVDGLILQRKLPLIRRLAKSRGRGCVRELYKAIRQCLTGRMRKEALFFFDSFFPTPLRGVHHVVETVDVNDASTLDTLRRCQPDVILTFGCSILHDPEFFEIPRFGIINLHSGIVPRYRGVDNVYWCLYNGEPAMIGATIHYIDQRIDTGDVLAQVFPEIGSQDDEAALFNKTIACGIDLLIQVLTDMRDSGARLPGKVQQGESVLYQEKQRNLWTDWKTAKMLRSGVLRNAARPSRRALFYENTVAVCD